MTTNGHNCNDFVPPSSLKELLDFFAKLQVPNGTTTNGTNGTTYNVTNPATKAIFDEIRKRLKGNGKRWIRDGTNGTGGPDPFCKDTGTGNNNSGSMIDTIRGLQKLRDKIHGSNSTNTNPYTLPDPDTDPCIKKYADAIISNAFPLFGCLFYLWFMCDNGAQSIRNGMNGNDWSSQQVKNGSSSNNLNKFLTDQQPTEGQNSVPMLPRGFDNAKLNGTTGSELFSSGADNLFSLSCSTNSMTGQLQKALFFLLFLAPRWHPAMSGHALLFLDWFDSNAKEEPFKDVQWLHVKEAGQEYFDKCEKLEQAIQKLAKGETSGPNIAPVHKDSISKNGNGNNRCNLYSPHGGHSNQGAKTILHNDESFKNNNDKNGHRKAHVFMQYVSWLWWCIPHLTASLRAMSADSSKWSDGNNFENSTTFGPFAFGFTFTNTNWKNGNGEQLKGKLQQLISGIEQFKCCIEAFFWAIRRPFAMGSLIAWIVAFTFLLYVNLLPLDLFHLKSHLLASSSFYRSDVIHSTLISNVTDVSYFKIL